MSPDDGDNNGQQIKGQLELPGVSSEQDRAQPREQSRRDDATPQSAVPTRDRSGAVLPQLDSSSYDVGLRERLFSFMTGRQGVTGASAGDVRAEMITAFGSSKRDPDRPDTAAVAKALGVSQRSVQRWLKGGGMKTDHASQLQRTARQAMTTKRGRARAMQAARKAGTAQKPAGRTAITLAGHQGVTSSLDHNYRMREASVGITDADVTAMQNAWVEGGEHGAAAWLHSHYDQHYTDQWHIRSIEDLDWGDSPVY